MLDPRLRVLLVALTGIAAITVDHALALAALTLLAGIALARSGLSSAWLKRVGLLALFIIWPTVASQALFYGEQPRTALIALGPLVIWEEGMVYGLVQSLRFVAVSVAGVALALSTPQEKLLIALRSLGIPGGLCFLTVTALRFMPTVGRELVWIRRARHHRGRSLWARTPWAWLNTELGLMRPVLARSLRRSRALAASMDMRGFDPSNNTRPRRALKWSALDSAVFVAASAACSALVAARVAYTLYTLDVAYHPSLRWVYTLVREWL